MKYYIGIDLGGTNIAVAVVDEDYKIIAQTSTPTLSKRSFKEIVKDMALVCEEALKIANLSINDVEHIGIGAPGLVDSVNQIIVYANNLDWRNVDIIKEFNKHINVTTYLANDADCAAYGELIAGAGKNYNSLLMLTLGTGVGGSVILNKKIFLGGDGFGIEPGHNIIIKDGKLCTCGKKGCLEAYASVTALIRDSIFAMAEDPFSIMHDLCNDNMNKVNGKTVFDAASQGDLSAQKVVEQYIDYLSIGVSNYITIFRPEVVIIGGGISNQGESLLVPLRKKISKRIYANDLLPEVPVVKAELGNNAGIIGAAFLGIQYVK